MDMNKERWAYLSEYAQEVFGQQDEHLARIMPEAVARDMPDISIGPEVGRLLMILTSMTRGRLAIEIGTLAGYSAIWIARGLPASGRLITIESEPSYAEFAEQQFEIAGVDDRVELRRGRGIEVLSALSEELEPGSVDVVFIDAQKTEYPDYWRLVRPLIAVGGLILADNVFGGTWWIGDESHPNRAAMDRFNRAVAGDGDFEVTAVPLRSGVLIARRMR